MPPRRSSMVLGALMAVQAGLGLALPRQYHDASWIRATWFANDWVTVAVAIPLLFASITLARRGSMRWQLIWLGLVAYAVYNYAYYLFGATLNAYLPLYIALVLLAATALGVALVDLDASAMAATIRQTTMLRVLAAYYIVVALGLTTVWLGMWAAHVFAGRSTPVEPEVFKLVAALDLTIMVPALATGGVLLWRRRPWGFVLSTIAGVQATLYLLVLSVGSAVAIGQGLAEFPGELPIWGTLMVLTGAATTLLLTHAHT